ncbi:MAG: ferredoxin--NADP reductase [Acidobacteria bacterium]|nr:ferredoxin--NADP reductase [Acidobacteriota bacterium]
MPIEDPNAVVLHREDLSPVLTILRVAPRGWELPDFLPGQYGTIGLPPTAPRAPGCDPDPEPLPPDKLIKRAYSVASSSVAKEYLEFYVSLVTSGTLTPRLWTLQSGSPIWLSPRVIGTFTLREVPAGMNLVLIATGTGLAPYVSMLRTELDVRTGARFAVLHGARHSWDLGYRSELTTMQRLAKNLAYLPVISAPAAEPAPWSGHSGYVQHLWERGLVAEAWGVEPRPEDTHVFLCGNPRMIETMLPILAAQGFREHSKKSPGEVHTEKYW